MSYFENNTKRSSLDFDEVFLDARSIPAFDRDQFEGRIITAIPKRAIGILGLLFVLVGVGYLYRLASLQVFRGSSFAVRSEDNTLNAVYIEPQRGVIYDRNGKLLAWNDTERTYSSVSGLAHTIGYVGLPTKEQVEESRNISVDAVVGKAGAERAFNNRLQGKVGVMLQEHGVDGKILSENLSVVPSDGRDLTLSIDSDVQHALYEEIRALASRRGFVGGAGVIMDIHSGELLALTSYPEYPLSLFSSDGDNSKLGEYFNDPSTPFLNRSISGLYMPGSIVKPFVGAAALAEGIITPTKKIESTGSIRVENPFEEGVYSIFRDWKAHGFVDILYAIAFSSNVYFYEVGGGYEDQPGLGITKLHNYLTDFGFGSHTGVELPLEVGGVVPSPKWKSEVFDGDDWRLGDTYYTAIGQYGFQITPIQAAMSVATLANQGIRQQPTILSGNEAPRKRMRNDIDENTFNTILHGMRLSATHGTGRALDLPFVKVGAKTGTAEVGADNKFVNSWVTGFFPYDEPRYAFAVVMERGPRNNTVGSSVIMLEVLKWMNEHTPGYLRGDIVPNAEAVDAH